MTPQSLSPQTARRLAITKQRLAGPYPAASADGMMEIFRDLGCVQIDPIRAVERTQYLVLWSRLGHYDPALLDHLLFEERRLFEYWGHAASIVLTEDYPLHQMKMRTFARGEGTWEQRVRDWLDENETFRQEIVAQLREEGPLSPNDIEDFSAIPWTSSGWSDQKNVTRMLGFMWEQGEVMVAAREGLRKKWALTENHLPEWTPRETLSDEEIVYRAIPKSLKALGVGTRQHINQHFTRGYYPNLNQILAQLVSEGQVVPVTIQGKNTEWSGEWYIHADDIALVQQLATGKGWQPRTSLLSPFDNLICDRDRTELMWDFYFRIEIYVPKAKRQYGYYVLPILHGEQLIGRIDPKMDRKTGVLQINAIYLEPNTPPDPAIGEAVRDTIAELGEFLGAKDIVCRENIPVGWQSLF